MTSPPNQRAIVVGATGAVGTHVVSELLASPWCVRVTTLGRRAVTTWDAHPGRDKLAQRVIALEGDGAALEEAAREPHDLAFCTLGIGRPSKVPHDEFVRVDKTWSLAFARGARAGGAVHLSLLGAVGANPRSRVRYLRVKGEVEEDLRALAFSRAAIFRPSILITADNRYGALDVFNRKVFPLLSWALPRRWHEVSVDALGRAMVRHSQVASAPFEVLHWPEFRRFLEG